MSNTLWHILTYASLPALALAIGGAVAAWRPPGPRCRSGLQHLAAGVVFAVVAVEMLPEIRRDREPLVVAVGFALGVLAMLGMRWLGQGEGGERPTSLIAGVAVDIALDGLLLGIAFAAGARIGQLLAFGLATECLSLGLATAATLGQLQVPRGRTIATIAAIAALFLAGATVGGTLLLQLSGAILAAVLAFGAAALLYLVTEELLNEAHEVPDTPITTSLFFVGFLVFLILGMIN